METTVGDLIARTVVCVALIAALGATISVAALAVYLPINSISIAVTAWPTMSYPEKFGFAAGVLFPLLAFLSARQIHFWKASIANLKGTVHRLADHSAQKEGELKQQIANLKRTAEAEKRELRGALAEAVAERENLHRTWAGRYSALRKESDRHVAALSRQAAEQADRIRLASAQHRAAAATLRTDLSAERARSTWLGEHVAHLAAELGARKAITDRLCGTLATQSTELAALAARCAALEEQLAASCRAAAKLSMNRAAGLEEVARSGPLPSATADLDAPDPGVVAFCVDEIRIESTVPVVTDLPAPFFSPAASGRFTLLVPGAGEAFAGLLSSRLALAPRLEADPDDLPDSELRGGGLFEKECHCDGCTRFYPLTHYGRLGVPRTASPQEIHAAYLRLARTQHPDKGGSGPQMQQLTTAADVLEDPRQRRVYDRTVQYKCDVEYKTVLQSLKFKSVTVAHGARFGVAFSNPKGDDFPLLRAVQPGSAAEEAGLRNFVGGRIAFVCTQRAAGMTGKQIHERFGRRQIMVLHFWP